MDNEIMDNEIMDKEIMRDYLLQGGWPGVQTEHLET